jgi:hypothetical protein
MRPAGLVDRRLRKTKRQRIIIANHTPGCPACAGQQQAQVVT